ncbi:MAG: VPLPA-CTERM sorting domain-containing protein [Silicimonas sp.]|nr:VPLPA-CTERM sorting domain-containing protein [Silicimonas sp.]
MKTTFSVLAAVATLFLAAPSWAITISSIDSSWENTGPYVSGDGTNQIRWGTSTGDGRSGYNFRPRDTSFDVEADTYFSLGRFTHLNFPITGNVLEAADLFVSFTIDGVAGMFQSVFHFDHWETTNELANCANGDLNGVGVNSNGCADRVQVSNNVGLSDEFVIDGVIYALEVDGFRKDGADLDEFWTVEGERNHARLRAIIRTVGFVEEEEPEDPENPSPVPLPASGLLLVAGVAGLRMLRRRG